MNYYVLNNLQKLKVFCSHQLHLHASLFQQNVKVCRSSRNFCQVVRSNNDDTLQILELGGNRRIAYRKLGGKRSPGIIYVPEFNSNMNEKKPTFLKSFCMKNNHPFLRFDYESVGESPGSYKDVHIGLWKENALALLDRVTEGPQLIIGSSLGLWISILAALERRERIHSLIGVATSFNFTDDYYNSLPIEIREKIDKGEDVPRTDFFGSFVLTRAFFDNSRRSFIPTDKPLPIKFPVTLLHSLSDTLSPFKNSITLAKLLQSENLDIILRKNATHQMTDDSSLELLLNVIKRHVSMPS